MATVHNRYIFDANPFPWLSMMVCGKERDGTPYTARPQAPTETRRSDPPRSTQAETPALTTTCHVWISHAARRPLPVLILRPYSGSAQCERGRCGPTARRLSSPAPPPPRPACRATPPRARATGPPRPARPRAHAAAARRGRGFELLEFLLHVRALGVRVRREAGVGAAVPPVLVAGHVPGHGRGESHGQGPRGRVESTARVVVEILARLGVEVCARSGGWG